MGCEEAAYEGRQRTPVEESSLGQRSDGDGGFSFYIYILSSETDRQSTELRGVRMSTAIVTDERMSPSWGREEFGADELLLERSCKANTKSNPHILPSASPVGRLKWESRWGGNLVYEKKATCKCRC